MGDMKTPDFDDLLAAFDIPDATGLDAKEAIQSSSDEVEGHIKPAGMCVDENIVTAPDVPVVSVIVKNTSRQDSLESCPEKDSSHFGQNILQNGFQSPDHIPDCQNATQTTYDPAFMNGSSSSSLPERNAVQHTDTMPSFSQFSPISSPEPEDSEISNAVVHKPADFPAPSLFDTSQCSVLDNQKNIPDFNMFDQCYMNDAKSESANIPDKDCEIHWDEPVTVEDRKRDTVKQHAKKKYFHGMDLLPLNNVDSDLDEPVKVIDSNPNLSLLAPSRHHIKSENSKFSSCLAALAALNSKEVDTVMDEPPLITREVSMSLKEVKISPKISKSPKSPRSPLEVVKRCATKQPDSPVSICSESSSKLSPSVNAGSPPAIPKVRIKTIKTSSGQIKRTVTSVLPDSEQEDLQSPPESSPLQYPALEYSALNVTPSSSPSLSSHENTSHSEKIKTPEKNTSTFVIPSNENQKLSNRKQERCEKTPEATTASLLCNGNSSTTVSSPNVVQQNQMSSTLSTANLLPKAVHLANLNLVPHSVAASVTARSAAQRQNQTQLTTQIVCSTVPLVHQVKKAASTPVPTFPNAVVLALNKLLNSANPVPLYVPNLNPPAECNIHLPTRGYRCLECGDSFGLEKSLAQHYGRRSMHIEVACNHCAKTLLFYNKCSLLAHAREHKTKGIVMQCSQLFMKPIPPEKMFASTSAFSSVASALQVTPITSNSSVPETVANTEPVMPLYPEKVTQRGFKCLDCNKQAPDYPALASHYQQPGQSGWKTCSECLMMLPNKCSYAAHQRIHSRKPPYCCPECGSVCRPSDFQSHLKKNCLHYARKIAYKCLHCDSVFMYFHQLKSHTEQKHCEILHKCSVCTMAYRSAEGVISHIQKKHATTNASTQLIYRCSCEIMFNNKKSLFQHISKQIICVFKCPECQLAFMQKMLLMQHFKSVHAAPQTREVPETQRNNVNLSSDHKLLFSTIRRLNSTDNLKDTPVPKSESNFKKAGWSCALCSQILPDREAYVSHMKKSHGKSVKRYPCRHCERSFSSSTSLKRHTRNDHNGKKVYTCWYCTDEKITFSKHFMLKNHISLIHGIKNPDFSQMSRDLQQENKNDMCSSELPVKRTADDADTEGSKNNTSAVSPPKKLKTEYKCAKCGFSTENTTEFQAHIPQHKSDSPTFQCLHCCLCYTSHISLNRHLFIVHKIKDPEKEDLQFDVCKKNIEISHLQRKSIINTENEETKIQCNFCSEIFKKQSEYSFHLKSHRMDNLNEERVDINQ